MLAHNNLQVQEAYNENTVLQNEYENTKQPPAEIIMDGIEDDSVDDNANNKVDIKSQLNSENCVNIFELEQINIKKPFPDDDQMSILEIRELPTLKPETQKKDYSIEVLDSDFDLNDMTLDIDIDTVPTDWSLFRIPSPTPSISSDHSNDLLTKRISILSSTLSSSIQAISNTQTQLRPPLHTPQSSVTGGSNTATSSYRTSPIPSSNASAIASESEDETFDDLQLPDNLDIVAMKSLNRQMQNSTEDNENDDFEIGLEFPDELILEGPNVKSNNNSEYQQSIEDETKEMNNNLKADFEGNTKVLITLGSRIPRFSHAHNKQSFISERESGNKKGIENLKQFSKSTQIKLPVSSNPNQSKQSSLESKFQATNAKNFRLNGSSRSIAHFDTLSTQVMNSSSIIMPRSNTLSIPPTSPNRPSVSKSSVVTISRKILKIPKSQGEYGDGSELSNIDEFENDNDSNLKRHRFALGPQMKGMDRADNNGPLHNAWGTEGKKRSFMNPITRDTKVLQKPGISFINNRNLSSPNLQKNVTSNRSKRPKAKPTLIRNLNNSDVIKVVGDMIYNPLLQKWEGNEEILLAFDQSQPSPSLSRIQSTRTSSTSSHQSTTQFSSSQGSGSNPGRPSLIVNAEKNIPQIIGNMVFDPVKMCWLGNEDEEDIFKGIEEVESGEKQ
ncbi:hypothetical protein HK096_006758, partial [Nowakowskiella sp. JEL0078]